MEVEQSRCRDDSQDDGRSKDDLLNAASWELVKNPTYKVSLKAIVSLPTLTLIVAYFCSFGTELAVNSFLGAYYLKNFPHLEQTGSGRWVRTFHSFSSITLTVAATTKDVFEPWNCRCRSRRSYMVLT